MNVSLVERAQEVFDEKEALNKYHEFVRESLKPYLTDEENEWLKTYTRGI